MSVHAAAYRSSERMKKRGRGRNTANLDRVGRPLQAPKALHDRTPCDAYLAGSSVTGRALAQLVAAACEVGDFGGVAGQLDGLVVRRARHLTAAQPA